MAKNNIHELKTRKGKKKEKNVFIPRFIRVFRTPHSERFSVIVGENFEPIGTLDLHITDEINATLVIMPDVEQDFLDLLITLVKVELIFPLDLEVQSFNIYKGVKEWLSLDEEDLFGDDELFEDEKDWDDGGLFGKDDDD